MLHSFNIDKIDFFIIINEYELLTILLAVN